ncbi:universal stress protein [Desulfohalovibrio reitneri]|uniref:universal stress protein n=1 Tax=Desulfohalovibrio reitneri TaxID=1307759 RepID=UPI0004A6BEA3|nr:universal stress protein [Desulfohalovibrio reitneri]
MDCKKILVAVDGSENATRAVEYTGEMMHDSAEARILLLCIERFPDRDLFPDEDSWKKNCEEHRRKMQAFLQEARFILEGKGIPSEHIDVRYVVSCKSPFADRAVARCSHGTSIAQEILAVLKEEGCGTVVVGRRGVSKAEEFLFGSVSSKIMHHARACTVWVVE